MNLKTQKMILLKSLIQNWLSVTDGQAILCSSVKIDWDKIALIKIDSKIQFSG